MASKKEHKRKQKNKGPAGDVGGENPFLQSGVEINSLDLLSSMYSVPKATEGRQGEGEAENTSAGDRELSAKEEQERRLREEEAERERREAEEKERRRRDAEEEAKAKREAEEAERKRAEEEAARREAERQEAERKAEEERRRRDAEEAERRRAEEEAAKREAERLEAERQAEEERRRREAEEAAKAQREAEEAERKANEERRRREAEAAELAKREAEEAEQKRIAEKAMQNAEEERQRREAEEAEWARRETEAAERARKMAEEAERARHMAEHVEKARREAEEAERRYQEAIQADRLRQEQDAAERAAKMAEETAKMRQMADAVARNRQEELSPSPAPAPEEPPLRTAPPLEVDNPYWQKQPEIFDALSGAPHGGAGTRPDYVSSGGGTAMPVTMTEPAGGHAAAPAGCYLTDSGRDNADPGRTIPVPLEKRMYIVMVTPEVAPCAKVGGLGDVILGLGRELMQRGHGVEVICPMYSSMRYDLIDDLHEEYGELWSPHYDEWRPEKVFQGKVGGGLQVNFITGGAYTERPAIYGFDDDLQRFTYFSRQALEFMYKTNRRPDIIHCHDWATGLVAPMLWDIYEKLGWNNSRLVYTIHNNECQGLCGFGDKLLSLVGMDVREYMRPDRMQDDTHKNCINMMKGGIVYSNFVTTVSPTYAGELKTAAGGRGLQTTIAKNSAKVGGVLNGIDYVTWNPATDDKLTACYDVGESFFEKYKNKTALREWLGMWDAWRPIISVVTRLTHQKGLDLIKHAIHSAAKLQAQFVLLGSAPDPKVNDDFLRMQHELRDNHDINLYIGYHEDLSHLIYAGSDMFLVPSLYEPCGLTQMISLRYGTVPIVRETGGLVDTVFDLDNSGRGLNNANGFTFRDANPVSLDYGLERAVRLWYDNPEAFNRVAKNGMRYDYSWKNPTEHYENIYNYIKA